MKRDTLQQHIKIANDIMYYIFTHIDISLQIDDIAAHFGLNPYTMQRIFKEIFNRTIHETIHSIRLQKSSNLLLTNQLSTISQIANLCGYSSHSSFIKAFKARFGMSPKEWRNRGYRVYSQQILKSADIPIKTYEIEPNIVKMPKIGAYYIRVSGYQKRLIHQAWQKIHANILYKNIKNYRLLALFHDNPTITPLNKCHYVACLEEQECTLSLPRFEIFGGLYAKFEVEGEEMLSFIRWVYHDWLIKSGFETSTKPSFAIYHKNNYIEGKLFKAEFYLPIVS